MAPRDLIHSFCPPSNQCALAQNTWGGHLSCLQSPWDAGRRYRLPEHSRNSDCGSPFLGVTMKLGLDVRNAIRFFAESLIAGDLGPGDSRDVRSGFFLEDPYTVGQAMAIFLYGC